MRKIYALVLTFAVVFWANADSNLEDSKPKFPVCHLAGRWNNQLGSQVVLSESDSPGVFIGEYYTAVETQPGAAGRNKTADVVALLHPKNLHSFVMNVMWEKGSLTSWVGQCYETEDGEVFDTTWLLLSPQPTLKDAWQSTRIGKDFFYRATDE